MDGLQKQFLNHMLLTRVIILTLKMVQLKPKYWMRLHLGENHIQAKIWRNERTQTFAKCKNALEQRVLHASEST